MKTTKLISIAVCLPTCVLAMLVLAGCSDRDENEPGSEGTQAETMVELETDLPPAKLDRTQKPRRKQGEAFLVPQGTKLLSRGVEVTSSEKLPFTGELEMITDGNEGALDGAPWIYYVELGPGLQWVQLDLGKPHALHAILVWHYYCPESYDHRFYWERIGEWPRVYQDVVVQISNDPAFKKDVKTVFNNDHDNSSGLGKGKDDTYVETSEGRWIDPKGMEGRYVRLYSRGSKRQWRGGGPRDFDEYNDDNHYIEVEVYGK